MIRKISLTDWQKGYVDASGNLTPDPSDRGYTSGKVSVSQNDIIKWSSSNSKIKKMRISFFDSKEHFYSRELDTTIATASKNGSCQITVITPTGQIEELKNLYIEIEDSPKPLNKISLTDWQKGYVDNSGDIVSSNLAYTSESFYSQKGDAIKVIPTQDVKEVRLAFYDIFGRFVSRELKTSSSIVRQDGTVRVTVSLSSEEGANNLNKVYVETTGEIIDNAPREYTLPWLVIDNSNKSNFKKFINKKYFSLGDSIVWNDLSRIGYQHYVIKHLKMKHTNHGMSGETVVSTLSKYKKLSFNDVDLVTIGFGVNDARLGVPLGTIGKYSDSSYDETTFYGAYRTLLDKIYTENPECRVVLLTPLQRLTVNGFGCDTPNKNGNVLIDYANAVISLGEMYATPVCDMYRNSGMNQRTLNFYTTEGVHPESAGYLRMANLLFETLSKF